MVMRSTASRNGRLRKNINKSSWLVMFFVASFRPERADFCRAGDFPGKISADFGRVNSDTSDRRTSLYKIVV